MRDEELVGWRAVEVGMYEIRDAILNANGERARDRRVLERKLAQRLQRLDECGLLFRSHRSAERPYDDCTVGSRLPGEVNGTESAVAKCGANLEGTERARMRVEVERWG
jgi:hypothetical protein